jgi:hypothetical protein
VVEGELGKDSAGRAGAAAVARFRSTETTEMNRCARNDYATPRGRLQGPGTIRRFHPGAVPAWSAAGARAEAPARVGSCGRGMLLVRKPRTDVCHETRAMWPRARPSDRRKLFPPISLTFSRFVPCEVSSEVPAKEEASAKRGHPRLPARRRPNSASVAAEPRPGSRAPDFRILPLFLLLAAF